MRIAISLALGVLAVAPAGASGEVRTIRFGGDLGARYEPAQLTVMAGDTVEWTGDFTAHPLRYRLAPGDPLSAPYTGPSPFRRTLTAAGDRIEFVCACDDAMRGVIDAVGRVEPRPLTRPPLLTLTTRPAEPVAGRPVTFVASYVGGSGELRYASFAWDLDGDGKVQPTRGPDRVTTAPTVTTTFDAPGRRTVTVTGSTSTTSAVSTTTSSLRFVIAAEADRAPPELRLLPAGRPRLQEVIARGLPARFSLNEEARITGSLSYRGRVLGTIRLSARRGTRAIRVRLGAKARAALSGRAQVRLSLQLRAVDTGGNSASLRQALLISRRP